jgi:hypothetical protein
MCANCHVVSVAVEFNSLAAIEAACKRLGWNFRKGQRTYRWVGRWYDDSPVPRNLFASAEEYERVCAMSRNERCAFMPTILGHCTHAIDIPGKGEIGIIERAGKFIPIWDYYSQQLNDVRPENGIAGFVQAYAVERAKIEATLHGNFCVEQQQDDGIIQLRVQVPDF